MSDFKTKMHQNAISAGALPRPCWESLQRSPDPLAGFEGPTVQRGGEWKGTDGTEWEWKEREGRDGSVVKSRTGVSAILHDFDVYQGSVSITRCI